MANPRVIDYYAILAVPPNADLAGIETAFGSLMALKPEHGLRSESRPESMAAVGG